MNYPKDFKKPTAKKVSDTNVQRMVSELKPDSKWVRTGDVLVFNEESEILIYRLESSIGTSEEFQHKASDAIAKNEIGADHVQVLVDAIQFLASVPPKRTPTPLDMTMKTD